jgi:hypothetical protein
MTWTLERRAKQSEAIRQWKPWNKSTGPKTAEGKSKVASNAWRGGHRQQLRELSKMVNEEIRHSRKLVASL